MEDIDLEKRFEYENGFYLTASTGRITKFATHLDLYRRAAGLAGQIIECGVFKGISLSRFVKFRSMFGHIQAKRITAFDTFGPFPDAQFDGDKASRQNFVDEAGDTSITTERLTEILETNGLNDNIELIKGNLLETAPAYVADHPELKISLLHVDVDLYEATHAALEAFYPAVVRGGIVILDDYGAFPGANKAIDEYFSESADFRVQTLPYSNAISFLEKP